MIYIINNDFEKIIKYHYKEIHGWLDKFGSLRSIKYQALIKW